MQKEEEIRHILLGLIRIGLLRTRVFGWDGLAEDCALEADHLHNLPTIVQEPKTESLVYYYDVERPAFIQRAKDTMEFEPGWNQLAVILATIREKSG